MVIRDRFAEDRTGPVAESFDARAVHRSPSWFKSRPGLQTSLMSPPMGEMMKWENIAGLLAGTIGLLVPSFLINGKEAGELHDLASSSQFMLASAVD